MIQRFNDSMMRFSTIKIPYKLNSRNRISVKYFLSNELQEFVLFINLIYSVHYINVKKDWEITGNISFSKKKKRKRKLV